MRDEDHILIGDFYDLSQYALDIPFEELTPSKIAFIEYEYEFEFLADPNYSDVQQEIINADEKYINLILKNLDRAIRTKSNNINLDFSSVDENQEYSYILSYRAKEKNNRPTLSNHIPEDFNTFKLYWLYNFIKNCKKVTWIIRDLLDLPQLTEELSIDIFKLLEETQKKEEQYRKEAVALFSSGLEKREMLQQYYNSILPKSLKNIDKLCYWQEKMSTSFLKELGYEECKAKNLKNICLNFKKSHLNTIINTYKQILPEDKIHFINAIKNAISSLKLSRELEGLAIAEYTVILNNKISTLESQLAANELLNHTYSSGKLKEKHSHKTSRTKNKPNSFTLEDYYKNESKLTDLRKSLIRIEMISEQTTLSDFRKVFSGEAIEKPIVWAGKISELSYFIKQLHNELKLVKDLKQQQWVVTINCFIQENGEPYNRTKLRTQKVPSTSKNIDSALNTLK
ncbi:hypothetical protein [Mesonia sp. HuA40]|uniref:hypothetical protein n=1 Tax=Mesonia sp. HuA40 TaxID=2602761 RepID=UPI0011CA16C2|nr:hypothetical protein [Mesonia sp. HuA40]TXK74545.1 hypothetical protein FT993_01885 [Mesonia sp. HuA40]